jgi:hypothetical protein
VWIVDLEGAQMHCFRSPDGGTYTQVSVENMSGVVSLAKLPDVTVDLCGIFDT